MRPDDKTLAALARLERDPDFAVYKAWLRDTLAEYHQRLVHERDADALRQHQGYAQALTDALKASEEAHKALNKQR